MALLDDDPEARTERPTNRRRQQARERGQVAHSGDLLIAARLVAIWVVLAGWFAKFATAASTSLRATLENAGSNGLDPSTAVMQLRDSAWQFATSASWPLVTATSLVMVAHFAQTGWLWRWERVIPQPSRLAPITGLQRMFSLATLGRALKLALKLCIVTITVGFALSPLTPAMSANLPADLVDQLRSFDSFSVQLASRLAIAMLTFATLDYAWQRWRFERSLQMTRDEVREELKDLEGDPRLKSQRHAVAQHFSVATKLIEAKSATAAPNYVSRGIERDV